MPNPLEKIRILLCDHIDTNRYLVDTLLSGAGATVVQALDSEQATQTIDESPELFDAVLIDMLAPPMSAHDAVQRMRSGGFDGAIVGFTSHTTPADVDRCLNSGCTTSVSKPLELGILVRTILEAINNPVRSSQTSGTSLPPTTKKRLPQPVYPHPQPRSGIQSTLPTDQPRFQWVVERFVEKLNQRLEQLQSLVGVEDGAARIAKHACWLKGAGGTVGFDCFTDPARKLEQIAATVNYDEIQYTLDELKRYAEQIETPWKTAAATSS